MAKTQLQSTRQRLSPKKLLGALVALSAAFLLATSVFTVAGKYVGIRRHIDELENEQETLREKHESLARTNAYLETKDGEEQVLREKYNVVKPGEGMILIVPSETTQAPVHAPSRVSRWWSSILHGIGIGKDDH